MKPAVLLAVGLAAAALSNTAEAQQCFRPHDIQGFTTANDNRTVYVRVGANRVFELRTTGVCPELASRNSIELNAAGSASTICSPIEVDLRVGSAGMSVACPVDSLRRLSPAETAALPSKLRP